MMQNRPLLKEYVLARLVTIAVAIYLLISVLFVFLIEDSYVAIMALLCIALAFGLFLYAVYRIVDRMGKELKIVNSYLARIEKIDSITYKAKFFTQEFEDINQNLMKTLKASQKREDVKQRYNTKLKLKNRQRADMISAIAHEFRNPIASIMGYAQTLEEDKNIPKNLQEKFLGKIYNNGNKIESLLSRLVLWNKFESGEATLHLSKFDIVSLANEIKQSLLEKYETRDIVINGITHNVEADRTLLEIVLKNLIENALKYSKEKIIVDISSESISVTDFGAGIASKDLSKVTKKFYRSGTHTWDNSMGLGLSIVKSILALHSTELIIQSEENQGSTFTFNISND